VYVEDFESFEAGMVTVFIKYALQVYLLML